MPRARRIQPPGTIWHVTTRGNNRRSIYSDHHDRLRFLAMVGVVLGTYEWRCLAYCLMGNHYHLVIRILEPTLSAGMQWLNGGYARSYNVRHSRVDHLFGRRFASELVEDEGHLREVSRYVVLNPVRAGICARPEDWPWSSYRATALAGRGAAWFDPGRLLREFHDDPRRAAARYVNWVDAGMAE